MSSIDRLSVGSICASEHTSAKPFKISKDGLDEFPAPMVRIGMHDRFGESGESSELLEYFGLDAKHIQLAAHHVVERKK